MKRLLIALAMAVGAVLPATAQDVYRPLYNQPTGYSFNAVTGALSFNTSSLTALGATLPPFVEAVRLTCSASCFAALSATTGEANTTEIIHNISGSFLPANTPVTYLTTGSEYVIVIGSGSSGTLYIQALTR